VDRNASQEAGETAMNKTDDDVLFELRQECKRWAAQQAEDGETRTDGLDGLLVLRDEALRRGLPVPMACPM
jgi:hypothetical protein